MTSPHGPGRSRSRLASFGHAFAGWGYVIRNTPNARIHATIGLAALLAAVLLNLDTTQWAVLWVAIGLVFTAEFFNTALEALVDLVSPEVHPLAKIAKDVAAGSVLFAACAAIMVGICLFGPPLAKLLIAALSPR